MTGVAPGCPGPSWFICQLSRRVSLGVTGGVGWVFRLSMSWLLRFTTFTKQSAGTKSLSVMASKLFVKITVPCPVYFSDRTNTLRLFGTAPIAVVQLQKVDQRQFLAEGPVL